MADFDIEAYFVHDGKKGKIVSEVKLNQEIIIQWQYRLWLYLKRAIWTL